jgi:hypothetical protein
MRVISACKASMLRGLILVDFSLSVSPKIKLAKNEIRGLGRSQSSADYSVLKHFPYCDHGL